MNNNLDNELIAITDEEKYIKNFQAIYYQMNAKPESMSKVFPKNIFVELDNISELNSSVINKFKSHYDDAGFLVNVIVSLEGRKTLEFNSWQKFEEHKWIESNTVESVVVVWEFNARLPKYKVPQKHRLVVKMSNGIKPEEMLNIILTGNLENMDEVDNGVFPLVARVDYIDPILAEELIHIVEKWRKGLKESNETKSKLIMKLKKHKRKVATLLNYVSVFITLFCGVWYLANTIQSFNVNKIGEISLEQANNIIYIVFFIGIFSFVVNKVFEALAQSVFEQLRDFSDNHTFNITKGDIKAQDEIKKIETSTRTSIILKFVGSVLFDLTVGIITSIINKKM